VPVLAKGKTHTGRCWVYVRDDRPFGGRAPPAAMFHYSRDRGGAHVEAHLARWSGLLQADAYSGYNRLYAADRSSGTILEAGCWAHARRPFFALADIEASARRKAEGKVPSPISPLALEIVQRMDRLFEIERSINGSSVDERRAARQELSRPLVDELEARMRAERPKLERGSDLAKAMDYMLKRWPAFTRFLDDGRVCLSNNAAERGLRGIALGTEVMAVCRLRSRRPACRCHVQPDRHGENERHRPAGLARRRPRAHRRTPGLAHREASIHGTGDPRLLQSAVRPEVSPPCGAHRMLTFFGST